MKFWFKRRPSVAFWLSLAVFAAGTSLAVASAFWLNQRQIAQAQKDYQQNVDSAVNEITTRLMQPVRGLNGLRAMYAARRGVTRSEFTAHVFSRDLPVEFPGVRGFGFIERVDRDAVDAFLERVHADEAPEFALRLLDAPSDPHYVITYIEPLIDNAGAQGLDVGSEARRRSAIEQAIDAAEPVMTAPITLVQDQQKNPRRVDVCAGVPRCSPAQFSHGAARGFAGCALRADRLQRAAGQPECGHAPTFGSESG